MITCSEEYFLKFVPLFIIILLIVFYIRFSKYYIEKFPNENEELEASAKMHWASSHTLFYLISTLLIFAFVVLNTDAFYYKENRVAILVETNDQTEKWLMFSVLFLSFALNYVIFDVFQHVIFRQNNYPVKAFNSFLYKVRLYMSIIFIPLFILSVYLFLNNRTEFYNEKLKTRNFILLEKEQTFFYKDLLKISFSSTYEGMTGKYHDISIEEKKNVWELILPNAKRFVLVEPEEKLINTILKHSKLKIDTVDIIYNKFDCE